MSAFPVFERTIAGVYRTLRHWSTLLTKRLERLETAPVRSKTVAYNLTATGNNSQATGYRATAEVNQFIAGSAGSADSVTIPPLQSYPYPWILIQNDTAVTLNVFPAREQQFNIQAVNTRIQVPAGEKLLAFKNSDVSWIAGLI